jgi:protein SCO1
MTSPLTPTFTLVDHHGSPVSEQTYRGRWVLAFFGFTHCQAVCPRALRRLSDALDGAGEAAGRVSALYITVDPERDTPEVMRDFLRTYPRFTGLTGSVGAVEEAKKAFRVFARRKADPASPGGYAVPHTAISYLITPDGQYADHFADALPVADVAARLRAHLTWLIGRERGITLLAGRVRQIRIPRATGVRRNLSWACGEVESVAVAGCPAGALG